MYDVTIVLLDDGYASTAIMPMEVFHSAGALWPALRGETPEPRFRVTTASVTGGPVRGAYAGLKLAPEHSIAEIERTDIVIVGSSGLAVDEKLSENAALFPWLKHHHERGAYIAGVCMGSMYLAECGLLDGRRATTHWAAAEDFRARYPNVDWQPDMMVTEDNRLLCSGGLTTAADLSLYLVEKLCGHEIALQVAKVLLMDMPRAHQTGYSLLPLSPPHDDARVRHAEVFLQTNFSRSHTTNDLAATVGMSPRTFMRRFKAATGKLPGGYLQAVRIETAKAMLEREGVPIQSVSCAVGYEDVAFFRALFRRTTGMTPAEYRARFAAMDVRREASAS